jgi:hypothetical protein
MTFYAEMFLNIMTKANFLLPKNLRDVLKENTDYKGSLYILITYSYKVIQLYSYTVRSHISFLTLLTLHKPM